MNLTRQQLTMPLTEQVRQLSSGTISNLTNLRRYDDIDKLRHALLRQTERWVELGVLDESATWQTAWNMYKLTHDLHDTLNTH